jgi:hypothetical protein
MPYRITGGFSKVATLAGGWVVSFTMPIQAIVIMTICFIAVDFIVGIITSYKVHKTGFETVRAWRTAFKLAGALTSIVAAFCIEVLIFKSEETYLARGVAGILCAFDFYSIVANFAILSNHPAFRLIKRFVKSEIESKLRRITNIEQEVTNEAIQRG